MTWLTRIILALLNCYNSWNYLLYCLTHRKWAINSSHLLYHNANSCYNIISILAMLPKPRAQTSKLYQMLSINYWGRWSCLYYDLGIKKFHWLSEASDADRKHSINHHHHHYDHQKHTEVNWTGHGELARTLPSEQPSHQVLLKAVAVLDIGTLIMAILLFFSQLCRINTLEILWYWRGIKWVNFFWNCFMLITHDN